MRASLALIAAAWACTVYAAPVEADAQDVSTQAEPVEEYYRPGWRCYRDGWRRRCFRCPYGRCWRGRGGYGDGDGDDYHSYELIKRAEQVDATTEAAVPVNEAQIAPNEQVEMFEEPVEEYGYGHRHGWHGGYSHGWHGHGGYGHGGYGHGGYGYGGW
ncbi:hypothetical protein JCM8202_001078 [Rhodotorula sphaerocarpa]